MNAPFPWLPVLVILLALALAAVIARLVTRQHELAALRRSHEIRSAWDQRASQLQTAILAAETEENLIHAVVTGLLALGEREPRPLSGAAFVPLDLWGKPLPAWSEGHMPASLMNGWAEYLAGDHVRGVCQACNQLHADETSDCPLLLGGPQVICFPVHNGSLRLGMLTLFPSPGVTLVPEIKDIAGRVAPQMGMKIALLRSKNRETGLAERLRLARLAGKAGDDGIVSLLQGLMKLVPAAALEVRNGPHNMKRVFLEEHEAELANPLEIPLLTAQEEKMGSFLAYPLPGGSFSAENQAALEMIGGMIQSWMQQYRANIQLRADLVLGERLTLSRELHDGFAQDLAYLKMANLQARTSLGTGDLEKTARLIDEMSAALKTALEDIRGVIGSLRTSPHAGLRGWLSDYVAELTHTSPARITMHIADPEPRFPEEIQLQLVRIIQESIHNARRHAQANHIQVDLRREPNSPDWILSISDDGVGFDVTEVDMASHYGLRGMRERADLIGGEFQIISRSGEGCTIRLTIPGWLAGEPAL